MTTCPRTDEVDAARDGRRRATTLAAISSALAALPVAARDDVAARRGRQRLLAAASGPSGARSRPVAIAALAVACAGAVVIVVEMRDDDPVATVTVQPSSARWSRHDEPGSTLVRLDDGDLELHVTHGREPHQLVVSLPDGELDDLGTTFQVTVREGRTSAVAVRDGAVVMRLVGQAPVFLVAGQRWSVAPVVSPASPHDAPPPPPAGPSPARVLSAATPVHSPATELRDVVRQLDAGNITAAIASLRAFIARHPDDVRSEDARYLLVIALQRNGDRDGARDAARAYVAHHPHGFRRAEVDPIAR